MSTAESRQNLAPVMPHAFDAGIPVSTKPTCWALGGLISSADIQVDVEAATERQAIGRLAELLAGPAGASKDHVTTALLRRERLGPTYIGGGMAMPHGRVRQSSGPAAAALRLRRPVDYGTTADDTADFLVGLTWPDAARVGFVPALAGIWRLLRKPTVGEAIRRAITPGEIFRALAGAGEPRS